jgi:N-dimethylarginine dimethylaminohydrolase
MAGRLARVMICPPDAAGWSDPLRASAWRELGYLDAPKSDLASSQHEALRRHLEDAGARVLSLPAATQFSLDAVYAHDASFVTDHGVVLMRMGKPARGAEPAQHASFLAAAGIPILGAIEAPGTVEAGDLVWLDARSLLVGRGYRTNPAGIAQLAALLSPRGVAVISAPLPHAAGPSACLHLMSLMSVLDERTLLVDSAWLAVETVELLRERGFAMIEIDESERASLACNVLALGAGRVVALVENVLTNRRLSERGFDVRTFPGAEISRNGSGGPTCLTRPLLRL